MPTVHRFDPREDIREDEVYIVARCACGWEGNAFPESEQGYEDAEAEFVHHQDASRHGLA